jgi:aminoglycoside phosphotransferase (APT) family kinase protein
MSKPPWHNDFPVTRDGIAEALRADIPELADVPLVPLGEGWDFVAWRADGRWVLRLPKRRSSVRRLAHEVELLKLVERAATQTNVQVPVYRWHVERPRTLRLAYGVYGYLPGVSLIDVAPDRDRVAHVGARLGNFLGAMHALPFAKKPRHREDFADHVPEFREHVGVLGDTISAELHDALLRLLALPLPAFEGEPRLCHADLLMEHVLVDGDGLAVIDWGDAAWADPWSDFVGLWTWGGDHAVRMAAERYTCAPSVRDWYRIRYKGACVAIAQAHFGRVDGRTSLVNASLATLARMQRARQLDDPALPDHDD